MYSDITHSYSDFHIFVGLLNKRFYINFYNLVCLYHGTLWFDHQMTAHPQCDVHRVGEWGSCVSSIFVGS